MPEPPPGLSPQGVLTRRSKARTYSVAKSVSTTSTRCCLPIVDAVDDAIVAPASGWASVIVVGRWAAGALARLDDDELGHHSAVLVAQPVAVQHVGVVGVGVVGEP